MRFEGSLKVWHIERGYGAVTPDQGGEALFIHISAFPAEGPQPTVGERISFEIVTGRNNQKQASRVQRLKSSPTAPASSAALAPSRRAARPAPIKSKGPAMAFVCVGLLVTAGVLAWFEFKHEDGRHVARLVSSVGAHR